MSDVRGGLKRHPLSAAWPDMPEEQLLELHEDVKKNGLREPVILFQGLVLDGWHRCKACQMAGIPIRTREFDEDAEGDPRVFVESVNGHRRHISQSQKAMAIVRTWEWKPAHRPGNKGDPGSPLSADEMAERAGVSKRTIQRAKVAESAGMGDAVAKGEISAKAAAEQAREAERSERNEPPPPPKKTPLDKAQEEITALKAEIAELKEANIDLADSLQSYLDSQLSEDEQRIKFEEKNKYISTLESQVHEWQTKFTMELRANKALRKRLGMKP